MTIRFTTLTLVAALLFAAGAPAAAQQKPPLSPPGQAAVTIGAATITIDYARPSMRGRKIMGELVPFDKVWRTGANAATTLKTSAAIEIGGTLVPAGTYTLYTLPGDNRLEAHHQQADRPVGHGVRPGAGPGARGPQGRQDGGSGRAVHDHAGGHGRRGRPPHDGMGEHDALDPVQREVEWRRRAGSSVVEHRTFNAVVVGSIPTRLTSLRSPSACTTLG